MKKELQQKPKKERAQPPQQGLPSFAPPSGQEGTPDASQPSETVPKAKKNGKAKPGKGRGEQPAESCPEGTMPLPDGNCVLAE